MVPVGSVLDRTPPNFRVLLNPPERASSVVSVKVLHNIYVQHGILKRTYVYRKKTSLLTCLPQDIPLVIGIYA